MTLAFHRHRVVPALLALLLGVFCWVAPRIHAPGARILRAHGGDLALAALLYLLAGVVIREHQRGRALASFTLLTLIELSQLITSIPRGGTLAELTIGSTFDALDVIAYALGVLAALGVERAFDGWFTT